MNFSRQPAAKASLSTIAAVLSVAVMTFGIFGPQPAWSASQRLSIRRAECARGNHEGRRTALNDARRAVGRRSCGAPRAIRFRWDAQPQQPSLQIPEHDSGRAHAAPEVPSESEVPIAPEPALETPEPDYGPAPSAPESELEVPGSLITSPSEPNPVSEPSPPIESATPFRFFAPNSIWNEPIPSNAPVDPASAEIMRVFNEEIVAADQSKGTPGYINTSKWSIPIYTVPANAPTVKVTLVQNSSPALQAAWEAVPLPADASPAAGTDRHLVVWQPSTDRLWEFWGLSDGSEGWHASWGGAMQSVSTNPGYYGAEAWPGATKNWGASGSSLSSAGGLITLEDFEMGQINHALAVSLPQIRANVFSSPAQRTDGTSSNALAIPMGAHLRLDPNLNLRALNLPHATLMLAEAAQKYGIIVRDGASNIAFYGQDPTPTGTEPYNGRQGYFGTIGSGQIVADFPWSHLELLQMTLHSRK